MPVTVRNTDILFNDGTTQSTAAGAIPTAFGAVGTYAVLYNSTTSAIGYNTTVAGSILRQNSAGSSFVTIGNPPQSPNLGGTAPAGTWRSMSHANGRLITSGPYGEITNYIFYSALFVRIS
jgi:hypothetical protein